MSARKLRPGGAYPSAGRRVSWCQPAWCVGSTMDATEGVLIQCDHSNADSPTHVSRPFAATMDSRRCAFAPQPHFERSLAVADRILVGQRDKDRIRLLRCYEPSRPTGRRPHSCLGVSINDVAKCARRVDRLKERVTRDTGESRLHIRTVE